MVNYNGTEIREHRGALALTDVAKALNYRSQDSIRRRMDDSEVIHGPFSQGGFSLNLAKPYSLRKVLEGSTKKTVPPFLEWLDTLAEDNDPFSYPVASEVAHAVADTMDSILDTDDPWTLLEIALNEGKKLRDEVRAKEQALTKAQPAIDFYRWVAESQDSIMMQDLAALITLLQRVYLLRDSARAGDDRGDQQEEL